jgi:hypothetical protein
VSKTRWHSCNVLRVGPATRQLWQFDAKGAGFVLDRTETVPTGKPLPMQWIFKDWRTLYQRKLNVAWLPPDSVFLRVVQLPVASAEETRAMVELQLEKLSPIPVTQAVWAMHVLPEPKDNQQTVVVVLVTRDVVEEFLGQLETQGFLADRLELSVLDQLQATTASEDGAWIYAESAGPPGTALVAWWFGGVLRNLSLASLPAAGDRAAQVRQQLTQAAWAGELEGWLTTAPAWHLVADDDAAREWEPVLRQALDEPIRVEPPQTADQLAGQTAHRAAQADGQASLLPPEFAKRYQQQFVDRLWMRGLLAIGAAYVIGALLYFGALGWVVYQKKSVDTKIKDLGLTYTNALQLKARYQVLQDRDDLKYAALDCWKSVAEMLPPGGVLQSLDFADGRKLTLNGTCPKDQVSTLIDYSSNLKKAKVRNQPLFHPSKGDPFTYRDMPGGAMVAWNFSVELNRTEEK